jgi:aspartate/methionine/tyrosine aminotransferase
MPRYPNFADRTAQVTGSVFEKFRGKMSEQGTNMVGLHIGDCYAPPPYHLPIDSDFIGAHEGFNRYTDTFGIAPLREALAEKAHADNQLSATADNVMMTCGACNALSVSMQSLINPGEDVLLLSPFWPFFRGMVKLAGGNASEVPFYTLLYDEPDMDIGDYLEKHITPKTVAIYVNTPNNPSGKVLTREHLQQLADFARRHKLWIISDEAYDGMTFDGRVHLSIASLAGMFDQTLSIFTFSKVYMFSGLRLGYVVARNDTLRVLNKMMVHQLYGPATIAQMMMIEPVRSRAKWSGNFVHHAWELRDMFLKNLKISPPVPEGTYYFFFDATEHLNGRTYLDVVNQCLDAGVAVAPGEDFGKDFGNWIRVCFTGEPPERREIAIERLNQIFPG